MCPRGLRSRSAGRARGCRPRVPEALFARFRGPPRGRPSRRGHGRRAPTDRVAVSVVHRQSWVWAVLPRSATRVDSHGDPALAEVLRESGYSVGGEHSGHTLARNGGIDAVLYDTEGLPDADDVARAVAELGEGGVVSIAVAGGRVTPPKAVPAADPGGAAAPSAARDPPGPGRGPPRRAVAEGRGAAQHATGHRRSLPQPIRTGTRGLAQAPAHAGGLRAHRKPRAAAGQPSPGRAGRGRGHHRGLAPAGAPPPSSRAARW